MGCRQHLQERYVIAYSDDCVGRAFATLPLSTCQANRGIRLLNPPQGLHELHGCARSATFAPLLLQETQSPVVFRALPFVD